MARFRVSRRAQADISQILATSAERRGLAARQRYGALLAVAMRQVADEPEGRATRERSDISPGLRSVHMRYVGVDDPAARVSRPVHILYYRSIRPGLIEIIRVLHERMEPARHLGTGSGAER